MRSDSGWTLIKSAPEALGWSPKPPKAEEEGDTRGVALADLVASCEA